MKSINEMINEAYSKSYSNLDEILSSITDALKLYGFKNVKDASEPQKMTYTYHEQKNENVFQICVNGEAFDEILVYVIEPSFVINSSMRSLGIYAIYCDTTDKGKDFVWTGVSAKDAKKDLYEAIELL